MVVRDDDVDEPKQAYLDVKGMLCPLPVLKARKALAGMTPGAILTVDSTDPAAVIDIPHFCSETGHALIDRQEENGVFRFRIRRREG